MKELIKKHFLITLVSAIITLCAAGIIYTDEQCEKTITGTDYKKTQLSAEKIGTELKSAASIISSYLPFRE